MQTILYVILIIIQGGIKLPSYGLPLFFFLVEHKLLLKLFYFNFNKNKNKTIYSFFKRKCSIDQQLSDLKNLHTKIK